MLTSSTYANWIMAEIGRVAPAQSVAMERVAGNRLNITLKVGGHSLLYRILLFAIGKAGRSNPLERRVEITTTYSSGLRLVPNSVDVVLGVERERRLLVGLDPRRLSHGGPTHNASTFVYTPNFEKLGGGGWFSLQTTNQLFPTEYQVYFKPGFLLGYLKQHHSFHASGMASVAVNVPDALADRLDYYSANGSKKKLSYDQQVEIALKKMQVGRVGESLVFQREICRLETAGARALSKKVQWISQSQPYLGYDIATFGARSEEEYVEVKSSVAEMKAFYFTANEMRVAQKKGNSYRLVCVSNVMAKPSYKEVRNPVKAIEDGLLEIESNTSLVRIVGPIVA